MTLAEKVKEVLVKGDFKNAQHQKALEDAERLADLYADIKPEPYVVPTERFVGFTVFSKTRAD